MTRQYVRWVPPPSYTPVQSGYRFVQLNQLGDTIQIIDWLDRYPDVKLFYGEKAADKPHGTEQEVSTLRSFLQIGDVARSNSMLKIIYVRILDTDVAEVELRLQV